MNIKTNLSQDGIGVMPVISRLFFSNSFFDQNKKRTGLKQIYNSYSPLFISFTMRKSGKNPSVDLVMKLTGTPYLEEGYVDAGYVGDAYVDSGYVEPGYVEETETL